MDERTLSCDKQLKELDSLRKENDSLSIQVAKLQEIDNKNQELISQAAVHVETITTLQNALVLEKIENEKYKTGFEKLGFLTDIETNLLDCHDLTIIAEKLLENVDLKKILISYLENQHLLKETDTSVEQPTERLLVELAQLQQYNENLKAETARMQVDISTLTSQVCTLNAQQTALQLANSQLVAEKEEVIHLISNVQNVQDSINNGLHFC